MKIASFALLVLWAVCLLIGCERRPLVYDYHPWGEVRIDVDWSIFGETPTGMTLMFFPEDGSEVRVHTTHEIESTLVRLKAGRYHILVFNLSPSEFGSLGFRGMDKYETVEVFAREITSKGYTSSTGDERLARTPERLGADCLENFEVTEERVEEKERSRTQDKTAGTTVIRLQPKCVVYNAMVSVRVRGLHNIRSVRGSMSGMAESYLLTRGKTGADPVTHLLEGWRVEQEENDYKNGRIVTVFSTFGLPGKNTRAGDRLDNRLSVSLLLVDNQTVKDFDFEVGDRIQEVEEELKLTIEVGTSMGGQEQNPEDRPVEVEEVKPGNGSGGGFDTTVDNWGEDVKVEIPI